MYTYDDTYYRYINAGALRSADRVLPLVQRHFAIRSVADFGAGQGAWLSVWRELGVQDVTAIDGEYIDPAALLIPHEHFRAADLGKPVRLGRTFDLVQSLEVAEHLPASAAETFVDNLVAHGSVILFSAAPPGQGGEHHVNERCYEYWRSLFRRRGYAFFDAIRPAVLRDAAVEPWYRYNSFLVIAENLARSLPPEVRRSGIQDGACIRDLSPVPYRIRKSVVRRLPAIVTNQLATVKKHWYARTAIRDGRARARA